MTPAGTSIDVQNGWEENTHTHTHGSTVGEVANPARGQLNRENEYFPVCPRWRLIIWSRETYSVVPSRVSLLILSTQLESGAYSRDSSRFPRLRRPFIYTAIRHGASGQSRVYLVTQLRLRTSVLAFTAYVEFIGTGPPL